MMMSREELIKEALAAYWGGEGNAAQLGSWTGMSAALAVFEKAHAPSDDEREVLLDELEAWQRHTGDAALGNLLRRVGSAIRRSEAHAPTDDFPHGHPEIDPTDDEREALRIAHLDARQAAYRKEVEDWFVDHDSAPEIAGNAFFRGWDAAVDGGFRRSEVPEPQGKPCGATPDEYLDHAECYPCELEAGHEGDHTADSPSGGFVWPEPQGEPSDAQVEAEHLRLAYDAMRKEYDEYRQWVRIAFTHNIAEADAKKIASRYVWHMTPSGGGLRNSAKAMQAALSEFVKMRVEAAHAAQGSKGA